MQNRWDAAGRWLGRHYDALVFVGALLVCGWALWIGLWRVPGVVDGLIAELQGARSADTTRAIVIALAAVLASIAIFGTIIVQSIRVWTSERQTRTIEQGHVTHRLTKAIEQLGAEKSVKRIVKDADGKEVRNERNVPEVVETTVPNLEVRLGAIYALERIAHDSERDHATIMEILCADIRKNAKAHDAPAGPLDDLPDRAEGKTLESRQGVLDARRRKLDAWTCTLAAPRVDIQAAATVIGRRPQHRIEAEHRTLDLRGTCSDGQTSARRS